MVETATISSKGQVTIPLSFRKKLGLEEGSKVAFIEGEDGNVYVLNASLLSLRVAQKAFEGVAEEYGFASEEEAMGYVIERRRPKAK